jgi:uncharacterized membrane protein YphA (DoxX/SURF4 family)
LDYYYSYWRWTINVINSTAKLGDVIAIAGMFLEKGLPPIIAYENYITEIVAPLPIPVGYRTRLAAAAVFSFIRFIVHTEQIFFL